MLLTVKSFEILPKPIKYIFKSDSFALTALTNKKLLLLL